MDPFMQMLLMRRFDQNGQQHGLLHGVGQGLMGMFGPGAPQQTNPGMPGMMMPGTVSGSGK